MGARERRKGHDFERKVARDLRKIDPSARRVLEYQEGLGYDIHLERLPIIVQVKSAKRVGFIAALQEAVEAKERLNIAHSSKLEARRERGVVEEKMPLAVCKVTGKGEYAVIRWADMLKLLKKVFIEV